MPPHPSVFIRKYCYEKYGYFNTQYKFADYDLLHRYICIEKLNYTYTPKIQIRMETGGLSNNTSLIRSLIIELPPHILTHHYKKNRLEEKKTKFDNDIKLYNYFKQNIKDNPKFEIPILFKKKFKNLTICEINNNLNFEYYIQNYSDDFLENSYQMLFEGGNKLDNFL